MIVAVYKSQIICELEEKIEKGYRIILYDLENEEIQKLLCDTIEAKNLPDIEIWCKNADIKALHPYLRIVTKLELSEILDLYHLYEFTDKLIVLSDNPVYPSISNYILQGIMTTNEIVEALLR